MSERASPAAPPHWLHEDEPFDRAISCEQIAALHSLLGPPPRSVIDLGCGGGRVLVPLARLGHEVIGLDRNREAIARCRANLQAAGAEADLRVADFLSADALPRISAHAVLCLGNTFMTISDVNEAVVFLRRVRSIIAHHEGGRFILDDLPGLFWPEVAEGNWMSGMSEDGSQQMIWEPRDSAFILRRGNQVEPDNWTIAPHEQRYRLWTDGDLALAAMLAGLSAPERCGESNLLVLQASSSHQTGPHPDQG